MINCAVIMGRLVADPELRVVQSTGTKITSFAVAVERKYSKQGEEKQADFIDVIAWKGTAEFVCKYFHKGSMIAIHGSIQTRTYEDKNGNKRKAAELVAESVSFCGGKNETATNGSEPAPEYAVSDETDFRDIPEDDLPFWQ